MKRHLAKFVLFLLLGAIINVAVAWRCVLWPINDEEEVSLSDDEASHVVFGDQRFDPSVDGDVFGTLEQSTGRVQIDLESSSRRWWGGVYLVRAGWPSLAMFGSKTENENREEGIYRMALPAPSQVGPFTVNSHEWRFLPLRPIWPGFAINTTFYAAILWLLFAFPFTIRRWRRLKRGRCIACGYDLRGSGTDHVRCPECGASASQPSSCNSRREE